MIDVLPLFNKMTELERTLIIAIGHRARREVNSVPLEPLYVSLDMTVVHATVGLDLQRLLDAPRGDFMHDVLEIGRWLDRETGELGGCLEPRYSKQKEK